MRGEFDADPSRLRENLEELAALLQGSSPRVRRRMLQAFGELVARWQYRLEGSISVVIEFLPDAARMSLRSQQGALPPTVGEQLLSSDRPGPDRFLGHRPGSGRKHLV